MLLWALRVLGAWNSDLAIWVLVLRLWGFRGVSGLGLRV